jgi:hypothetical protein
MEPAFLKGDIRKILVPEMVAVHWKEILSSSVVTVM